MDQQLVFGGPKVREQMLRSATDGRLQTEGRLQQQVQNGTNARIVSANNEADRKAATWSHDFSFMAAVEDDAALRAVAAQYINPARAADMSPSDLLMHAIQMPPCINHENGLSSIRISKVANVPDGPAGLLMVHVRAVISRPDVLWQKAQAAYAVLKEQPLDAILTTDEQIQEVLYSFNTNPRFSQMGLKVWPHESVDDQEDVCFTWTYPDGHKTSLPAYVDENTGFVCILGKLPPDQSSTEVEQVITTSADFFRVDYVPVMGSYMWALKPRELDQFRGSREDHVAYLLNETTPRASVQPCSA